MGSDQDRVARRAEGSALAESLIGLQREQAVSRAMDRGFDPEVISHTEHRITMDLSHNRIRLFLDKDDKVVRAWAG
jgi:hypothetical protein